MDPELHKRIVPLLADLSDQIGELIESSSASVVRETLAELKQELGEELNLSIDIVLLLHRQSDDRNLPILMTGVDGFDEGRPYQTWGDASFHRYIVDGEIQVVPHDYCPKCWAYWATKFEHPACDHCQALLGRDVKLLIDNDLCPYCEKGAISSQRPKCTRCGFQIDPSYVAWG